MRQSTTFTSSRNTYRSSTTPHVSLELKSCISTHIERDAVKLLGASNTPWSRPSGRSLSSQGKPRFEERAARRRMDRTFFEWHLA